MPLPSPSIGVVCLLFAAVSPASARPSCAAERAHVEFSPVGHGRLSAYVIDLVCDTGPRFVRLDASGGNKEPVKTEGAVSAATWAVTFGVIEKALRGLPNYACPEETGRYDLYYLTGYLHNDEFKQICRTARLPKSFKALFRAIERAAHRGRHADGRGKD